MSLTVTLRADSLASKWGFQDGDILDEFGMSAIKGGHDLLIRLVRTHLLPLLPEGIEVEEIGTCHNPIRATHNWRTVCDESDVTVEITEQMVAEALNVR